MKKQDVLTRFCVIGKNVADFLDEKQKEQGNICGLAHDCFCQKILEGPTFSFDRRIIEFVEAAVNEKMQREKQHKDDLVNR